MPDKVIDIPGIGPTAFPDSMTPEAMNTAAAKLYADANPKQGRDYKILGVNIHVPAEEKPRLDSNMVGWGDKGAGLAPEDALMAGQAARSIGSAVSGVAGYGAKALAAIRAVGENAGPVVKYEAAKHAMGAIGIPDAIAIPVAMALSGYKKGGKPTVSDVAPAGVETAQETLMRKMHTAEPTVSEPVASAPEPVAPPAPPAAQSSLQSDAPGPSPAARALPNQKALNEAALAARREAYQQQQAATTPPPSPAAGAANVKLNAAETRAFMDLLKQGMPGPSAMKSILEQRDLMAQFGLTPPTAAETRFPKGMRGKVSP